MKWIFTLISLVLTGFISCEKQVYEQGTADIKTNKEQTTPQVNSPVTESLTTSRNTFNEKIKVARRLLHAQRNDTLEIVILNPTREAMKSASVFGKNQ